MGFVIYRRDVATRDDLALMDDFLFAKITPFAFVKFTSEALFYEIMKTVA